MLGHPMECCYNPAMVWPMCSNLITMQYWHTGWSLICPPWTYKLSTLFWNLAQNCIYEKWILNIGNQNWYILVIEKKLVCLISHIYLSNIHKISFFMNLCFYGILRMYLYICILSHRNAILNIYVAYNVAGKDFGNVLMSIFYTCNFHI